MEFSSHLRSLGAMEIREAFNLWKLSQIYLNMKIL